MSEELNVVEEKKECNCPVCKLLKSDCTKKFVAMTLASFIGCSLAILLFAPKKPPRMHKCPPPCIKMWDRQVPPPHFRKFDRPMPHHIYKSEMKRYGEFRKGDFRKDDFKRFKDGRPDFDKKCPKKFNKETKIQTPQPKAN